MMDTLSLQYDIHKGMKSMSKAEKVEAPKEKLNADKEARKRVRYGYGD